jgi:DhnA family fructose-bisphosphate aldolase class Ia
MIHNIVEQAIRADAAAILAQWIDSVESPALVRQCRENIVRLKPSCERFSIPLIIESAPEHARCALAIGAEAVKISGLTSAGQLRDIVSIRGKTPIFAAWSASLDVSPETMFELGAQAVVMPVLDDIDTPGASTL